MMTNGYVTLLITVMAMTAAAAAALLGGVTGDTNLNYGGFDDGVFGDGGGGNYHQNDLMNQDNRCDFDNPNDAELAETIFNMAAANNSNNTFQQSLSRQPVIDFAPLLDFGK